MNIFIVEQISRYYSSINRHSPAARLMKFAKLLSTEMCRGKFLPATFQEMCRGKFLPATFHYAASYKDAAEILVWLRSELSESDSESRYWLDCVQEITDALWLREHPSPQADRIEIGKGDQLRGWDKRRFKDLSAGQLKAIARYEWDGYSIESLQSYRNSEVDATLVKAINLYKADVHVQTDYARLTIGLKKCGKQIRYRRHRLEQIQIKRQQAS